ncbi:MAG: hypothetical protein ABW049_03410 [Spongiibacteraceae bacterium]
MNQQDIDPVRILGSRLCAAKPTCSKEELARLSAETADAVFAELQQQVLTASQYLQIPTAVRGLAMLVKAQPHLQGHLLDLLENLPAERCGPWLARGWEAALPDEEYVSRYITLLKQWRDLHTNDMLSHAARLLLDASGI